MEIDSNFVMKERWAFQDTKNMYIVLDYMPGGDLADQLLLKKVRNYKVDEKTAKFFVACLI